MPRGCFGEDKTGPGSSYCVDRRSDGSYAVTRYREDSPGRAHEARPHDRGDRSHGTVGRVDTSHGGAGVVSGSESDAVDPARTTLLDAPIRTTAQLSEAYLAQLQREDAMRADLEESAALVMRQAEALAEKLRERRVDEALRTVGRGPPDACRASAWASAAVDGCVEGWREAEASEESTGSRLDRALRAAGGCLAGADARLREAADACGRSEYAKALDLLREEGVPVPSGAPVHPFPI